MREEDHPVCGLHFFVWCRVVMMMVVVVVIVVGVFPLRGFEFDQ